MAIMITGGTGFLGSHLARYLLEQAGETDVVLFDHTPNLERIADIHDRLTIVQGNVLEPEALLSTMQRYKVDRIVHLAYVLGNPADPASFVNINCTGTAHLFEAARRHGVKRVAYASSAAVYGVTKALDGEDVNEDVPPHPSSIYGACKFFNEHLADIYWKQHGLDLIGLRPVSVFGLGRGQRLLSSNAVHFMVQPELAALGQPAVMPPDAQVVDWIYAADAAQAWYCALTTVDPPHRVFNMASEHRAVGDVTKVVRALLPDADITVSKEPADVLYLVSAQRLRSELGFKPRYTIEEGMVEYLNAVRSRAGLAPVAA